MAESSLSVPSLSVDELRSLAGAGVLADTVGYSVGVPAVLVPLDHPVLLDRARRTDGADGGLPPWWSVPCLFIGVTSQADGPLDGPDAQAVDLVLHDPESVHLVLRSVERHPQASITLALTLRSSSQLAIDAALVVESASYSVLQSGPEFAAWRAERDLHHPRRNPATTADPTVLVDRANDTITITLHRPDRHNAVNRQLRDELSAALSLAVGDPAARVVVRGDGPSFCSGGDLDEFGTFDDPATAHLARMTASVGLLMARLAPRTEVHLHGMCLGAGIELPAFADKVAARGDSRFGLPEIELGLIPGAGGTVSLPRRIGRLRTAELALTARTIDAATALRWGLIDEIER